MNEEELYKLLNIPNKPWIELTDEEIQLFEKNNNYIKQLQQENENLRATIKNDDVAVNNLCKEIENLKQQLKDKDEKISKVKEYCLIEREDINGSKCDDILEILESNKED